MFITLAVDAKEETDVMSLDIPNAFIQAKLKKDKKNSKQRVAMKITEVLVDILVKLVPEIYTAYVVYKNGKRVLYVEVLQALYGLSLIHI